MQVSTKMKPSVGFPQKTIFGSRIYSLMELNTGRCSPVFKTSSKHGANSKIGLKLYLTSKTSCEVDTALLAKRVVSGTIFKSTGTNANTKTCLETND